jgi:ATF/CREB family transcription factor
MLTGPTGATDYFDGHLRGGFPTPNESSLRTGLTPGGGGSMFPAPSPNSQALFNQLASAGVTPGTLDFHRTAMNAAAAQKGNTAFAPPADSKTVSDLKADPQVSLAPPQPAPVPRNDPFGQHDANDAANGLFLLAQARNGPQGQSQAAPAMPQSNGGGNMSATNNPHLATQMTSATSQAQNTSPVMGAPGHQRGSLGGSISGSARAASEMSIDSEESKPNIRTKGKKGGSSSKGGSATTARRKAESTPSKAPASKKSKANAGNSISAMPDFTQDSDEEMDMSKDMLNEHGKKMTDEEKRKNFLERNRYDRCLTLFRMYIC